jgi:hypothetical protein
MMDGKSFRFGEQLRGVYQVHLPMDVLGLDGMIYD